MTFNLKEESTISSITMSHSISTGPQWGLAVLRGQDWACHADLFCLTERPYQTRVPIFKHKAKPTKKGSSVQPHQLAAGRGCVDSTFQTMEYSPPISSKHTQ